MNWDIYGARVSGEGTLLDLSSIWDTYWDVYATQITSGGTVVTADGFSVVYNARETGPHVALASAGGQQSFVAFSRYDTEPNQGSRRIRGQSFVF